MDYDFVRTNHFDESRAACVRGRLWSALGRAWALGLEAPGPISYCPASLLYAGHDNCTASTFLTWFFSYHMQSRGLLAFPGHSPGNGTCGE
eukprot:gene1736-9709_t